MKSIIKVKIYHVFTVLTLIFQSHLAAIHSLHGRGLATQGTLYPRNIQFLMVDDIIVYYYNSVLKESSIPKWLNHSQGVHLWKEIRSTFRYNRFVMDSAVKLTSQHFNHSHDHIYQVHGQCSWDTEDEHVSGASLHAYDGKDFVHFDVGSRTWKPAAPNAAFYKRIREENPLDLLRLVYHYEIQCIDWLKKLLHFSKENRKEKVPDVVLTEKSFPATFDKTVTCHATGFYPRGVQVQWLDQEGHILDGVSSGEVLPNGDGTYQVKGTLKVPAGAQWSQMYSCHVQHSSVAGNITVVWDPKRRLSIYAIAGCSTLFIAVTVLVLIVCIKREKCHQNRHPDFSRSPSSKVMYGEQTRTCRPQSTEEETFSPLTAIYQ